MRMGEIPVFCDRQYCDERGEKARCYLDIYKLCNKYNDRSKKNNSRGRDRNVGSLDGKTAEDQNIL